MNPLCDVPKPDKTWLWISATDTVYKKRNY